jgi:hypothetical protein
VGSGRDRRGASRLRSVHRTDNKTGRALKSALANSAKVLRTATPPQNPYGVLRLGQFDRPQLERKGFEDVRLIR